MRRVVHQPAEKPVSFFGVQDFYRSRIPEQNREGVDPVEEEFFGVFQLLLEVGDGLLGRERFAARSFGFREPARELILGGPLRTPSLINYGAIGLDRV